VIAQNWELLLEMKARGERPVSVLPRPVVASAFGRLAAQWKEDTRFVSSVSERVLHPAYQQVIGMGEEVLPLLFADLKEHDGDWFWALRAITRVDPVDEADWGKHQAMKSAWLAWARDEGYVL
jgi:hypothetical protein